MNVLHYRDYQGSAELDMDRKVCRGKILFIEDLVTYEAGSPSKLQSEFEAAVDDYIETCKQLKREPKKPFKGLFNVRVSPELHKKLHLRSLQDQCTLNETVTRACQAWISNRSFRSLQVTLNDPPLVTRIVRYASNQPVELIKVSNAYEHAAATSKHR